MSVGLYKSGDKVRIADYISGGRDYGDMFFAPEMEKYKEKVLTIDCIRYDYYLLVEDENKRWCWVDEFFEPVKKNIFAESNAILLANGEIRLVHEERLYLPNGTSIGCENYEGRKHNFDSNFDIVEVHDKATGNYLFELSGELIKEE